MDTEIKKLEFNISLSEKSDLIRTLENIIKSSITVEITEIAKEKLKELLRSL